MAYVLPLSRRRAQYCWCADIPVPERYPNTEGRNSSFVINAQISTYEKATISGLVIIEKIDNVPALSPRVDKR